MASPVWERARCETCGSECERRVQDVLPDFAALLDDGDTRPESEKVTVCYEYRPLTKAGLIVRLRSELLRTREALRALLVKLDEVAKATEGVYVLAHVHGMGYSGPTYEAERAAARAVLPEFAEGRKEGPDTGNR